MIKEFTQLSLKIFNFNLFSENTYILFDKESRETAIIDPGNNSSGEDAEIVDFIAVQGLTVKYLINTHGHLDHIFGNGFIAEKYKPEHLVPEKDLNLMKSGKSQAAIYSLPFRDSALQMSYITEQTEILLGSTNLSFIYTPGHTPGEFCLYSKEEGILFSGDVLFRDSIGRTDLWGGDLEVLLKSINEKLLTLPDDTVIFPGHGEETTIGYERVNNIFLD